jgi:hypothetical protein
MAALPREAGFHTNFIDIKEFIDLIRNAHVLRVSSASELNRALASDKSRAFKAIFTIFKNTWPPISRLLNSLIYTENSCEIPHYAGVSRLSSLNALRSALCSMPSAIKALCGSIP